MIHLASTLLLSALIGAGHPLVTGGPGENHNYASAELLLNNSQQESAMAVFAASLTQYYVGVARPGPNWTAAASKDLDDITKANRVYLADLVAAKKLVGAGRVLDGEDWAWLLFFKGDSLAQAKTLPRPLPR